MQRLIGDAYNQRYKQSTKYIDPVDDDGYTIKREIRKP